MEKNDVAAKIEKRDDALQILLRHARRVVCTSPPDTTDHARREVLILNYVRVKVHLIGFTIISRQWHFVNVAFTCRPAHVVLLSSDDKVPYFNDQPSKFQNKSQIGLLKNI